jgi:hypothetical protein
MLCFETLSATYPAASQTNLAEMMRSWNVGGGSLKRIPLLVTVVTLACLAAANAQISAIVLNTVNWHPGHLPDGWQVKVAHGTPEIATVSEGRTNYLDLKSHNSSFGLEREVDVDPLDAPYLTWKWRVKQLPPGGDFRHLKTDDQAAQVLVAFTDRRIISYIWDTNAPQGAMENASWIPLVHIYAVVCRSGATDLNQWVTETRNLADDYQKAYGHRAPRVKGIRLQINTQHTGTAAESCFGEVAFHSTPQS